jgi:hypothetical protein
MRLLLALEFAVVSIATATVTVVSLLCVTTVPPLLPPSLGIYPCHLHVIQMSLGCHLHVTSLCDMAGALKETGSS